MATAQTAVEQLMSEVVGYGPFALTRFDVRKLALLDGHDKKNANFIAFGCCRHCDSEPMTLIDVADFLDHAHGEGFADHIRGSAL